MLGKLFASNKNKRKKKKKTVIPNPRCMHGPCSPPLLTHFLDEPSQTMALNTIYIWGIPRTPFQPPAHLHHTPSVAGCFLLIPVTQSLWLKTSEEPLTHPTLSSHIQCTSRSCGLRIHPGSNHSCLLPCYHPHQAPSLTGLHRLSQWSPHSCSCPL